MTIQLPSPISGIKTIAISICALAILGIFAYLIISKSYLQQDLAQSQQDVVALTQANKNWQMQVGKQNDALMSLQKDTKDREDAAKLAIVSAQKTAQTFQKQIDALNKSNPAGDDCAASKSLLQKYLK